jgi:MFS family permease
VRARWSRLLDGTALLDAAALSVIGVAGLVGQRHSEPAAVPVTRADRPALRNPGLRVLAGMSVALGAMFVAVDLATVAFAQHHGDKVMAGPLLGLYGLGSAIAGLWYGTRSWRSSQKSRLTAALAATVLGVAPLGFMPGIWPMAGVITVAGLGISATLATSYRIAEMTVPAGQRTEAMSWLTIAAATGTALGAPLAGSVIDVKGAAAGYLFAFGVGVLGVAFVALRQKDLAYSPPDGSSLAGAPATG